MRTAEAEFGRVDVLVANAGVLRDRVLWKMEDGDFDTVVETHLRGSFTCGRAAAMAMRERGEGGRIILIGSPAGQFGSFGQTNYATAKAGLVAMARTWSLELARAGITANAVIPTALSPMTATIPAYTQVYEDYRRRRGDPVEYRRDHALGTPEDVAPLDRLAGIGCRGRGHRPGHRHRRRSPHPLCTPRGPAHTRPRRRVDARADRRRLAGRAG